MDYCMIHKDYNSKEIKIDVCFSRQFKQYKDFTLYISQKNLNEINKNNYMFLSEEDFNLFVYAVNKEFGGIYKVEDFKNFKLSHIRYPIIYGKKIHIRKSLCKGRNKSEKKYFYKVVCTYLRYLFENPYSKFLKKAIEAYRKDPSIHLFSYLYNAHRDQMFGPGHSVAKLLVTGNHYFTFKPIDNRFLDGKFYNSYHMVTILYEQDYTENVVDTDNDKIINSLKMVEDLSLENNYEDEGIYF